jgi:hypothetical protein
MPSSSGTMSASQNRIQRLRSQQTSTSSESKKSPNASLMEKRKQMKERRLKNQNKRKMELVQKHRAHQQALRSSNNNETSNVSSANSPRSLTEEAETDDDTLVSVRRIVHQQSPKQPSPYFHQTNPQPSTSQQNGNQQQSYNSLSSLQQQLELQSNSKTTNTKIAKKGRSQQRSGAQFSWVEEEKSEKAGKSFLATSSSGDYSSDKESLGLTANSNQSSSLQEKYRRRLVSEQPYTNTTQNNFDDDDKTFDYANYEDNDSWSAGSGSYAARRAKEAERRQALARKSETPIAEPQKTESPFMNQDDVEHFRKSMDSPAMRIGMGVAGAATIGALVGPVGLLVGAAVISIGFSVTQIPSEERTKLQSKASSAMQELQEKACDAAENLGNSCATHYQDSGVHEQLPLQVADHLPQCLSSTDGVIDDDEDLTQDNNTLGKQVKPSLDPSNTMAQPSTGGETPEKTPGETAPGQPPVNEQTTTTNGKGGPASATDNASSPINRPYPKHIRNKKVACLRNGRYRRIMEDSSFSFSHDSHIYCVSKVRILPPGQIYSLDPAAQPRAWLGVVASANTCWDEKNEAMEEMLILAKDKRRARILLEEGILDYLIWVIGRYLEKTMSTSEVNWKYPNLTPNERIAARQAAACCVTLGKAHCAAIHTEGDLLLMSLYKRGIVPEERQVAQMLYEVPQHVRITKTDDPTIVEPSKEVFAYRELDLAQAEKLAKQVKQVADGKL